MKTRLISLLTIALLMLITLSNPVLADTMNVLKSGLGSGTITSNIVGINCGADCDFDFPDQNIVLSAVADQDLTPDDPSTDGSVFAGWSGMGVDCAELNPCTVDMTTAKRVIARFNPVTVITRLEACSPTLNGEDPKLCTADDIQTYLDANPHVNTAAKFIAALHPLYKQNWILMSRSESLQTGTALSPRILLPSYDARFVFSVGMTEHDSFPGSHHNAIEYMQWDEEKQNFRFHEIILDDIPEMHSLDGGNTFTFAPRERKVEPDDAKCSKCHSSQNVPNTSSSYGTTPRSATRGESLAQNKPNWDAYDSWGGMTPFNRDRIYEGSIAEATFEHIFNLWNWRGDATKDRIR
ncbi:MAG: hypothetical protein ACI8WB_004377, partial [Phenylobacterium sp.]